MSSPKFDIVVYGATGFTGQLIAEYLATQYKADAGLKAQITMGEADGESTKIYADAFTRDKEFYGFWRRLEAYKQAFAGGGTMVLSPDSDFFRYFSEPPGRDGSGKK